MKRLLMCACLVLTVSVQAHAQGGYSRQVAAEFVAATGASRTEAQRRYALRGFAMTFAEQTIARAHGHGADADNSTFDRNAERYPPVCRPAWQTVASQTSSTGSSRV